jgi:uncharacterized protein YcsI (UPF0317 family)
MNQTPGEVRLACRDGRQTGPTPGLANGHAQANLVIVPAAHAADFREFCARNPRPCPLLEELPPGEFRTRIVAASADIRTDLPCYRVWRDGKLAEERPDIEALWESDWCAFLLGCSFSFEEALEAAAIEVRHITERRNVPMYITSRACEASGPFSGPLVVSMRPLRPADVPRAVEITSRFPRVHGAPVHVGDPAQLGIGDLGTPDFGDPPLVREGEVPCFWACGVTPQQALQAAKLPIAVTHSPGCMLVCDVLNADLAERPERRRTGAGVRLLLALLVAGAALFLAWEEAAPGNDVARQSLLPRLLGRLFEVPLLGRAVA